MRFRLPRLLLMLALVAVLLRAMVPAGYMPDIGANKFQMVICSLDGPQTVSVEGDYNPLSQGSHQIKEKCEFSLLQHTPFENPALTVFAFVLHQKAQQKIGLADDRAVIKPVIHAQAMPRAPPVLS